MASGRKLQGARDLALLLDACEDQGFKIRRTSRGHWMIKDEGNRPVATFSGTPSDSRAWANGLAAMLRAGLIWPPPGR